MKTLAFFNNKGGVGKTSLVYHLAWMFVDLGRRVVAVDLDPQSNLSGMFLNEEDLEEFLDNQGKKTIDNDIEPLFAGTGDISPSPYVEEVGDNIGLLVGDLALSKREDDLSRQWPLCLDEDVRAFRVTTAFARLIASAGREFQADLALVDVGPNLGALNRASLVACDHVVVPLAPDLFSLQGLRNVGPILGKWRKAWSERCAKKPANLELELPKGSMQPAGYIVMRHSVRSYRPVRAFARWIEKIPAEYQKSVMEGGKPSSVRGSEDPNLLAHLKDYRSLMPLAQEASKPMFHLKPADGAIGGQQAAVGDCYHDFKALARKIAERIDLPGDD